MSDLEEARKKAYAAMEAERAKGEPGYAMRSCWNCNGAHEHLKKADYVIQCFECGHWFFRGIDITEEKRDE